MTKKKEWNWKTMETSIIVSLLCTKSNPPSKCRAEQGKTVWVKWWCFICHRYIREDKNHEFRSVVKYAP